jgi:putative nucleotidyltransferase with HDIG domain
MREAIVSRVEGESLQVEPLPPEVSTLLARVGASPRLVAHLTLVHDVACQLIARLDALWPMLSYDRSAVRLGAALHDIGKVVYPEELTHPGHSHELAGEQLLRTHGFSESLACFARTHEQWSEEVAVRPEDLLVAVADRWWRGRRDDPLEATIGRWIAGETQAAAWQVYTDLDDIAADITADADARLAWQQQFPV